MAVGADGDRKDTALAADDAGGDAQDSHCDAVVGRALALNDLIGGAAHGFKHRVIVRLNAAAGAVVVQVDAGDVGARPDRQLAVPVLADDKGVDIASVDAELTAQQVFQTGGVQHRARADDAGGRESGQPARDGGQQIHRIGDHEQDGLGTDADDLRDDRAQDSRVALEQLDAGLSRLLVDACGDDHQCGAVQIVIGSVVHAARRGKRGAVADVHRLAVCALAVDIHQHQLGEQTVRREGIGGRRTDAAAADDAAFLIIDRRITSFFSCRYR